MNIFLPYEDSVEKSVQSLDDARLIKQILEVYQLSRNAISEELGKTVKGYKHHPIYVHYKNNIPFLAKYGYKSCIEYTYRLGQSHRLMDFFMNMLVIFDIDEKTVKYTPFYMEGSVGQPNYIRTTGNVS